MTIKMTDEEVVKEYQSGRSICSLVRDVKVRGGYYRVMKALNGSGVYLRKRFEFREQNCLALDNDYFVNIDTAEKAYWLGYIFADGSVREGKMILCLKDYEPVAAFKKAIKSDHKLITYDRLDKRTEKTYVSNVINVTSRQFVIPLIAMGVFHTASKNYPFPPIEDRFVSHFLRGLFDGDGSVVIKDRTVRVSLIASHKILDKVDQVLERLGAPKRKRYSVTTNNLEIAKVHLYRDGEAFLDLLYTDSTVETRLARKYDKLVMYKRDLKPFKRKSRARTVMTSSRSP